MSVQNTSRAAERERERGQRAPKVLEIGGEQSLHSLEAELALLACCLIDGGETVRRCRREGLVPKSFASPANALLFEIALKVLDAGHAVTVETVWQEARLSYPERCDDLGGEAGLHSLADTVATTNQAGYFIAKVRDLWRARCARWWFSSGAELLRERAGDWAATWAALEPVLAGLQGLRPAEGREGLKEQGRRSAELLVKVFAGQLDTSRHVGFGLPKFEEQCGKLQVDFEDYLVVLAARPSGGKSALARGAVGHALRAGQNALVFILETTTGMWIRSLASTWAGVNLRDLEKAPLDLQEKLARAHVEVEGFLEKQLWIRDDVYELDAIMALAREQKRKLADAGGLHLVVVDYLQMVAVTRMQKAPREQQVAYISRQLKLLAKELGCPVLVLAQLNRGPANEDRRPRTSDLRESGAIEQDADRIMLLHVPKFDVREVEQTENQHRVMVELIQAKSRNGAKGLFRLWFDRPWVRFSEVAGGEERVASMGQVPMRASAGGGGATPGSPKGAGGYGRAPAPREEHF